MRSQRGMTMPEILTVIVVTFMLVVVLLPMLGSVRRDAPEMKNSSQLRGLHQSSVIFANSNGSYLPGMNSTGALLDSTDATFSALSGANTGIPGLGGGGFNTRLYILLNGNFIAGDLVLNPRDTASHGGKWTNPLFLPAVPTSTHPAGQFSYSLSNIADTPTSGSLVGKQSPGRVAEWRDNANSQSILFSDRNSAKTALSPRSVWATSTGDKTDWKGNVVWGDNHAEFLTSSTGFNTKYDKTVNTNDSLFHDGSRFETAGEHRDNAFFNWVSANF